MVDVISDDDGVTDGGDNINQKDEGASSVNNDAANLVFELREAALLRTISLLRRKVKNERNEKVKALMQLKFFKGKVTNVFNENQLDSLSRGTSRGMKWSNETIRKALQLRFACGSTGYNLLLQQQQPLPSLRSLRRRLEFIHMEPGILGEVFSFLQVKVSAMKPEERDCCLTLDEMCIQPGLQYDQSSSCLRGDVTLPGHNGVATHALVFMLGGITTRWKQIVAYYFTGNSVQGETLKPVVLEIIQRAKDVGLHISTVTSDMGSANRALMRSFGIICVRDCEVVNKIPHPCTKDEFLYFMHDVPHIVKNLWASFVRGNVIHLSENIATKFQLPSKEVTVEHVKKLIAFQENRDLKLAPKLTVSHVSPTHFEKMKVSGALTLFSHSVYSALHYLVDCEGYDKNLLTTAWFIQMINKWFDIMSSRHPVMALSQANQICYKQAVSHLEEVIRMFNEISIGVKGHWKPFQTGVILSTTTILALQRDYLSKGHKFLLTSRFTQDCLENLFSSIRLKNPVPSALEFRQAIKIISVAQFLKCSNESSYSVDDREFLADFLDNPNITGNIDQEDNEQEDFINQLSTVKVIDSAETSSLHYIAGYCIKKVKKSNTHCSSCLSALQTKQSAGKDSVQKLSQLKEYKANCLVFCSNECMNVLKTAECVFRENEHKFSNKNNLLESLVKSTDAQTQAIIFPSCHDIKNKILKSFFSLRLHIYAKKQENIRKAKMSATKEKSDLGSKSMMMRTAVQKYK